MSEENIIDEKAEYLAASNGTQTASILADVAARPRPLPTGIVAVDRMLGGGFEYGNLYVLASAPGMGKTTLALQMAANISANGSDVLYVSLLENTGTLSLKGVSRCTRELSEVDALTTWQLKDAAMSDRQLATLELAKARHVEEAARLYMVDVGIPTSMDELERIVDSHERLTGNTPFVVVDYFQHLRPSNDQRGLSPSDKDTENVMRLKTLALQLRLPLLVLSSISRSSYYVKVSTKSLNEAGGIEYAADVVLGLQPIDYSSNDKRAGKMAMAETMAKDVREMSLSCVKNRDGGLGEVALRYHAAYNFFEEMK